MTKEEVFLNKITQRELPKHIAIIMDGNGRWAKKRGFPRIYGHRAGTKSVREVVRACGELGLEALSLYTFSTENWSRPREEINALMELLCIMLRKEVKMLNKNNIRLRAVGRTDQLPPRVQRELSHAMDQLKNNRGLILNLALNYGGRQEIIDAVNKIIKSGAKQMNETVFSQYLYTNGLRDPDLVIRTSGEQRISNFFLYQSAYSEVYSTSVLWPDFKKADLYEAILEYQSRERRFGAAP